jgi:hypothetical protein
MSALVSSAVLTGLGFVLYFMLKYARVNHWCAFVSIGMRGMTTTIRPTFSSVASGERKTV